MVANLLVHLEHVDTGLLKDGAHQLVTYDLTLVAGVLKLVRLDVLPELLDYLGPRKLRI